MLVSAPIRLNPQSAKRQIKIASRVQIWNCAGPGTASKLAPEAPRGAVCATSRADSESDDDGGA
eukprot:11197236-Alexandrium_andersonii.AAC.1